MRHEIAAGARIGLITEGAADLRVVATLIKRLLRLDLVLQSSDQVRLGPKPEVLRQAPKVIAEFLDSGCQHVVVLWDSGRCGSTTPLPADDLATFWQAVTNEDRQRIRQGFAPLPRDKICPVVVVKELETWLLADERALSACVGRRVRRIPRPERAENPKASLKRIFEQEGRRAAYVDYVDAERIAQQVPDTQRLRRLRSFMDLVDNLGA